MEASGYRMAKGGSGNRNTKKQMKYFCFSLPFCFSRIGKRGRKCKGCRRSRRQSCNCTWGGGGGPAQDQEAAAFLTPAFLLLIDQAPSPPSSSLLRLLLPPAGGILLPQVLPHPSPVRTPVPREPAAPTPSATTTGGAVGRKRQVIEPGIRAQPTEAAAAEEGAAGAAAPQAAASEGAAAAPAPQPKPCFGPWRDAAAAGVGRR